jgi:hypothetical protein
VVPGSRRPAALITVAYSTTLCRIGEAKKLGGQGGVGVYSCSSGGHSGTRRAVPDIVCCVGKGNPLYRAEPPSVIRREICSHYLSTILF